VDGPTAKMSVISGLKTRIVEKEKNQFKSERKTRQIFAPANGVFSSKSLLEHPELAQKEGIHFSIPYHEPSKETLPSFVQGRRN